MDIRIKKADATVTVAWDNLPDSVQEFVKVYGLTQILNDCHSQLTKDKPDFSPANVMALVEKKLATLYSGELRAKRESASGDGIDKLVKMIAEARVNAKAKAKGLKLTKEERTERVAAYIRQHGDGLRIEAQEMVDDTE